jgi:hypothetical protein
MTVAAARQDSYSMIGPVAPALIVGQLKQTSAKWIEVGQQSNNFDIYCSLFLRWLVLISSTLSFSHLPPRI